MLWDTQTQEQVDVFTYDRIGPFAFSLDGGLLALVEGSQDIAIRLWDVAGRVEMAVIHPPYTLAMLTLAFAPDGKTLASTGYGNNGIHLWDVQTQQQVGSLTGHTKSIWAIAFSPDGTLLASGGHRTDEGIRLWDVQTQQQVGELIGHLDMTLGLAFSPDGKILASAGGKRDKVVYLWDVETRSRVGVLGGHSAHVGSIAFSPDGALLASTVYWDNTVHLWDVETQDHVKVLAGHDAADLGGGSKVGFSSDGKWLACGSENGVELWAVNLPGAFPRAYDPSPTHRAADVFRQPTLAWIPGPYAEQHDVYLGTDYETINHAGTLDPVYRGRQNSNSYPISENLPFQQTYYWRVDEVNGPPDYTVTKGNVWHFTTESLAYPILNMRATASSAANHDMGPEKTTDGSGLNELDEHSVETTDMWLSSGTDAECWIQYEFDKVYKLHEMWAWNSNQAIESNIGLGAKDVTVETSKDGQT